MTTHLIIPDQHAHPELDNDRATWLGYLIADIKPDIVINMGDAADMESLSSFDKGKRSFITRDYRKDINAHLDFQERMWEPVKRQKKKLPWRVFLEGNHERRIQLASDSLSLTPGAVTFEDLEIDNFYDQIVRYRGETPGIYAANGVLYSHYFVAGTSGRAISSENIASYTLSKMFCSTTQAHSHLFDFCIRTDGHGNKLMGTCAGCFIDKPLEWAGEINKLWDSGVVLKRNVHNGCYDLEWISIDSLKKEYG